MICFCVAGLYFVCTHPPPPSPVAVEQATRAQVDVALPIGSTREEVETWLESQGIHRANIEDSDGHFQGIWVEKTMYKGFFYNLEVQMEFSFDQNGNLSRKRVRVVSVGL